eukprot:gb/GECG01013858.1/.p1 GENE.gb/GECG01013858.1/~~gb/GECG01013858.1/.p1  ORF type:complete len:109 (+),score=9.79 gb/GECG01013858.1/:1-327(+)
MRRCLLEPSLKRNIGVNVYGFACPSDTIYGHAEVTGELRYETSCQIKSSVLEETRLAQGAFDRMYKRYQGNGILFKNDGVLFIGRTGVLCSSRPSIIVRTEVTSKFSN